MANDVAIVAGLALKSRRTTVPSLSTPAAPATDPPVRSSTPPTVTRIPPSAVSVTADSASVICPPLAPSSPTTRRPTFTTASASVTVYVPESVINAVSLGPGTVPVLQLLPSFQFPPAALTHETFAPVRGGTTSNGRLVAPVTPRVEAVSV